MAEQLRRQVRRRKVGAVKTVAQTEAQLRDAMDGSAHILGQIEDLQNKLLEQDATVVGLMEELNVSKFSSDRAEADYNHPPQKTVNTIDAAGLFEDVSPEDFLASVVVQKGKAEKVVDPKVLKKHMTSTKSALKPKTLKLKMRK